MIAKRRTRKTKRHQFCKIHNQSYPVEASCYYCRMGAPARKSGDETHPPEAEPAPLAALWQDEPDEEDAPKL